MNQHDFLIFAFACLMLNVTPGNDMLFVISRSTGQGIKAGVISALGIMAGCLIHITAAVIGLSALIARSAIAFDIIKFLGAAYLIYLGVQSMITKAAKVSRSNVPTQSFSLINIFRQGVLTNVLNPKVALFFLAFIPQFISQGPGSKSAEILFLGSYFCISGTIVNITVAVLFGKIGNWLSHSPKFLMIQQKITGLVLIALGIKVALSSKK